MSGTNKLIEEMAIKETSEAIASRTTLSKTTAAFAAASHLGVTTCRGGCNRETHGVTRHGKVPTPRKPEDSYSYTRTKAMTSSSSVKLAQGSCLRFKCVIPDSRT